ncbi:ESX-5 secretion system ATPase EccB5 [Mycobacterium talmoniae]|uniref:ESX-5 secretion system ATPase EccB5 n=1 Tax=Mycobacterium talmoniae TaxID=1858794 RepID=A0A2S8BEI9_9MYCO|nr:ESX-5 secretion system ATPase EccB5 [Mycobacterium talmoniae]
MWLRSRTGYALTLRNVNMHFDLARWIRAMPVLCAVMTLLVCAGAFIFSLIHPAGVVRDSRIVMDRASGEVFVNVNGRLHPALNLSSARLIVGAWMAPTPVAHSSIAQNPIGPRVGIPGAPDDMEVSNGSSVSAAVCQRAAANSVAGRVAVTVLDGGIVLGERARPLAPAEAVLAQLNGQTYVIWNGSKSLVDPQNRIVLSALGIGGDDLAAATPLSGAVGNAIPTGLSLAEPVVPNFGEPAPWNLGVEAPVGAVVQSAPPGQAPRFFLVLIEGVQEVPQTVAAMIRSRNAFGAASPRVVSPDALAAVPRVNVVSVSQYPAGPVRVISVRDRPVTCWWWREGRGASAAETVVLSGTELPIRPSADADVVQVVSSHKGADGADAVYMAGDAANYVAGTGNAGAAATRETMWWLSRSGTRFGLSSQAQVRESLGLSGEPLPMPWVLLRLFPRGLPANVALSKEDAMTQHDNVGSDARPAALLPPSAP